MDDLTHSYWTDLHKKYSVRGLGVRTTKFAEEVLEHLPSSGKLLDLGAGQGQDSRFFAQHGFQVVSTDFAVYPLTLSQEIAEREGVSMVFQEVDIAKKLPFPDESFDVAYSHMALHYFDRETTKGIFSEIHRVLKVGGVCATVLNTVEDPEINSEDFEEVEKDFYKTKAGIYKRFFSADSLREYTQDLFETVVLDAAGRTYKDDIETLIRFVGKKSEE